MTAYADVPSLGTARVATETVHFLGEGPVWDPIRDRMLWVDIMLGAVHTGLLSLDGSITPEDRYDFPDTAGAVAVSQDGELLVAGVHRLHRRGPDGVITSGPALIGGDERRFNDGKPDPAGRFVVGTMGPGNELLLRIDGDEVGVLDDDLTLANGLAWTADGRRLYTVDTSARRIFVRDYDPGDGVVGERQLFLQLEEGHPDGMTIDEEGHLWVAVWGGGCVLRVSPRGEIVSRVDVPAPHTSCPVFAGPDLDVLVITTARENLSPGDLEKHPLSGRLFTIRPGVRGLAPHYWNGVAPASAAVPPR
ncbi:SMP-30/gluconolactonase/LRE family protein [Microbacterium sp. NPDC057407]|uniref:SMP-30/gluconolactonase/LRE family protein n=1 Tax=Microbacterium sp. NPDC057407 TaxID=3346120 RepID=UPI00366ECDEF